MPATLKEIKTGTLPKWIDEFRKKLDALPPDSYLTAEEAAALAGRNAMQLWRFKTKLDGYGCLLNKRLWFSSRKNITAATKGQ